MSEYSDLADFLRGQAASGDFGHDRERFARAAQLLDEAEIALTLSEPAKVEAPIKITAAGKAA